MSIKRFIFCALDFSDIDETIQFLNIIKNEVGGIKLGLEFFSKNGLNGIKRLKKFNLPIFLDLKLHDIPNTVKKTLLNIIDLEPNFLTIHLSGGKKMIEEVTAIKNQTKIIGVSMLTSLDKNDLCALGINISENEYVHRLVNLGLQSGIDGVVCSPNEVKELKVKFSNTDLFFVTPGIRLENDKIDDQKRLLSPGLAIKYGSSMLVIGRPITKSPDPIKSINNIKKDILRYFESKN